jgi:hypothetical protein
MWSRVKGRGGSLRSCLLYSVYYYSVYDKRFKSKKMLVWDAQIPE